VLEAANALSCRENRGCEDLIRTCTKGTCWVSRVRRQKRKAKQVRRRVRIGAADASLTGLAGLVAVDELIVGLDMVRTLDRGIGRVKQRARGLSGGQLLLGMATAQLVGQDCLAGLDRVRADAGSALLTEAPVPASTTAAGLAARFGPAQRAGIETGLRRTYQRWLSLLPAAVRAPLVLRAPTVDLDASDIEVYGLGKQNVGWNYAGMRCGRVHLASWAQAELPLAADLLAGNDDVRPDAAGLLRRALSVLPAQVCGRPRVRAADAGYFDAKLAVAAVEAGCDFAIAAKRNPAAWRAFSAVPEGDWRDARDMTGALVAACDYAPEGWPPGTYTIIRRVKVPVERLSNDPRSRRRRTVAKEQLALALGGAADHVWAVSFLVTNSPADSRDYSRWKPGSGSGPASRNASGRPSTAVASTTCPPLSGVP
jgi:Transposase DDE domain group 1